MIKVLKTFITFILFTLPVVIYAQGDLLITPRRVVFEGNTRSIDLNLANTGRDTAVYAISLVQIRMTDEGAFETITEPEPGQKFADQNIRFFPRQVTLGPGESQVVKVQLYRQNQLATGEYRSHFYFRAVENKKPLGTEQPLSDPNAISVMLKPVFGITIPVIIRVGDIKASVTISDLSFSMVNDTVPNISMLFTRNGDASIYGNLTFYHVSSSGTETKIGVANGVAVYTPNKSRRFKLNLSRIPGVDYTKGMLKVVFTSSTDIKPEKYAEAETPLGK
ncbi:MAG TPA: hypothetical protein VK213_12200 [Bacteroidales bacterium]|nr:hypothetical protein [Bacteroidales bacterium]